MTKLKINASRMNAEQLMAKAEATLPLIDPPAPGTPPVPNMAARATKMRAALQKLKDKNAAYEAAKAGLPALKQARDEAADELRQEHTFMGSALEVEANGDSVALAATGYELVGDNTPATTPPGMIDNLKLTAGDEPGALDGSFDPEPLAYIYEIQCTSVHSVNGPWENCPSPTASVFRLIGLTSGQRVWVRVRAIGTQGPGPWSDPYTKIVP